MAERVAAPYRHGAGVRVMTGLSKRVNPFLARIAASGLIGVWGVIHHTGRRSGRAYATPIALRRTINGFVIPLPYSEHTDWCRNVLASGSAVITWHGTDHMVTSPEVVDRATAAPAFPSVLRLTLRLFGISRFLQVRMALGGGRNS